LGAKIEHAKLWVKHKLRALETRCWEGYFENRMKEYFEKSMLGRIFWEENVRKDIHPEITKKRQKTVQWAASRNALFHGYPQKARIKEDELGETCSTHGRQKHKFFLSENLRRRWKDDIKLDLKKNNFSDWIKLRDFRLPSQCEIFALLGRYAALVCRCLPAFRNSLSVASSRVNVTPEDGTDTLSRKFAYGSE
jgi:hypothetical protein